jgi:hypothetical protein
MKKYFVFMLAVAAFQTAAFSQTNKEPYLTKSLSGQNITNVKAETSGGSISVSGASTDTKIEVYITGNNGNDLSKDEIQKKLSEDYDLTIDVSGGTLKAIAKPKHDGGMFNWKKALNIAFKIYVPQNVSTKLATSGGSIHLDNLSGDEDFSTSGGSLHVDKLTGHIHGRTSGGSIHVSGSSNDIDLATSGGSIEASDCKGNIKLETSGGSLKLNNLNGTVEANTSGGSINGNTISGELSSSTSGGSIHLSDLACSLETSTSGGNIDVDIKQLGKFVKIDNSGGNVQLTLPAGKGLDLKISGNKIKTSSLSNFSGDASEGELKGKLNGGGIPVTINSSSHVQLTFN